MNKVQSGVKEFMLAAGQECPNKPLAPDNKTRILRIRLLLEEVLELASASGVEVYVNNKTVSSLEDFGFEAKYGPNLIDVADALADISYVNYGAAIAYGLDLEPFENEVHKNNLLKIKTGYKDENGKWRKGFDYKPVDLSKILQNQISTS